MSGFRFYSALPGNTWLVNATDFGHADCLDETYASGIEVGRIRVSTKRLFFFFAKGKSWAKIGKFSWNVAKFCFLQYFSFLFSAKVNQTILNIFLKTGYFPTKSVSTEILPGKMKMSCFLREKKYENIFFFLKIFVNFCKQFSRKTKIKFWQKYTKRTFPWQP